MPGGGGLMPGGGMPMGAPRPGGIPIGGPMGGRIPGGGPIMPTNKSTINILHKFYIFTVVHLSSFSD